ncbi:MAG: hypothetical protein H6Q90_2657 [Deltaproteobacteria bacterium]|nr:hypothetical protein [Deltaproteobacteria bacterium]
MQRTSVRFIAPVLAVTLVTGCGAMLSKLGMGERGTETAWSRARPVAFSSPECSKVIRPLGGPNDDYNAISTKKDPSAEAQILLLICPRRSMIGTYGHELPTWPLIEKLDPEESYFAQDDTHPDVIGAALSVVGIANRKQDDRNDHDDPRASETGLALFWSTVIPPAEVEAALAPVQLAPDAKQAFLAFYRAAPSMLRVDLLSPVERNLVVDIPVAVYKERQAHITEYRQLYDRLAALRAEAAAARAKGSDLGALIDKLVALRGEFLVRCGKLECKNRPLYADATRELATLDVVRGDVVAARAESSLFAARGSYVAGLPQAVRAAQAREAAKLREQRAKFRKAKDSGADDATARQLAGGEGAQLDSHFFLEPPMALANFAAALEHGDSIMPSSAEVASLKVTGATAHVVFKLNRIEYEEPYDCKRTNRITRIRDDGSLEYEEDCKYRKVTDSKAAHPPIDLPASEAKGLRVGEMLSFLSGKTGARVVEVRRKDAVVQLRGDRLP